MHKNKTDNLKANNTVVETDMYVFFMNLYLNILEGSSELDLLSCGSSISLSVNYQERSLLQPLCMAAWEFCRAVKKTPHATSGQLGFLCEQVFNKDMRPHLELCVSSFLLLQHGIKMILMFLTAWFYNLSLVRCIFPQGKD